MIDAKQRFRLQQQATVMSLVSKLGIDGKTQTEFAMDSIDLAIANRSDNSYRAGIYTILTDFPTLTPYLINVVSTKYPEHKDYLDKLLVLL